MKTVYPGFGLHLEGDRNTPAVAMNSNGDILALTCEQHEIHYRVGKVNVGDILHGDSHSYVAGANPAVAINGNQFVVGCQKISHDNISNSLIWYHGTINSDMTVTQPGSGYSNFSTYNNTPVSIILTANNILIAAIQENATNFKIEFLEKTNNGYQIMASSTLTGSNPRLALNPDGKVIVVYVGKTSGDNSDRLCYRLGYLHNITSTNPSIHWGTENLVNYVTGHGDDGVNINNIPTSDMATNLSHSVAFIRDTVVISYEAHSAIVYTSGISSILGLGITDDVTKNIGNGLRIISGNYTTTSIDSSTDVGEIDQWSQAYIYDGGHHPAIAATTVQCTKTLSHNQTLTVYNDYLVCLNDVGDSESNNPGISYSISLITDHARWMENLNKENGFYQKYLYDITMPASHDAGMVGGLNNPVMAAAITQNMSIYEQLCCGVRYFDLRVDYDSSDDTDNQYVINHNFDVIEGSTLKQVLSDVSDFMSEYDSKELVILKFSHFNDFDTPSASNTIYSGFTELITQNLSDYLCDYDASTKFRDQTIQTILTGSGTNAQMKGRVLVVCDDDFAKDYPVSGIYVYRDGSNDCSTDSRAKRVPCEGNLVVWDCYSDTTSYDTLKRDQITVKYNSYNGYCTGPTGASNCENPPCDMFLLSWTLTPSIDSVFGDSLKPDARLSQVMNTLQHNSNGKVVNLLYVNFTQHSRATTISILMGQGLMPVAS